MTIQKANLMKRWIKGKFVSKNIVNLSKWKLTKGESSLLSKGLKFVPTSNNINKAKFKMKLEAYNGMLRLKWHEAMKKNLTEISLSQIHF